MENKEIPEEIWRRHIYNATFQIKDELHDLQATFRTYCGSDIMILDKYTLYDRQLALMISEAKRLIDYIQKLDQSITRVEKKE